MLSFALKCRIPDDRTLTVTLPEEIQPGEHEILVVIDHIQAEQAAPPSRSPGSAKGRLIIHAEDDGHLEDFRNHMP